MSEITFDKLKHYGIWLSYSTVEISKVGWFDG